ncbi:hypothetical protein M5689_017329 [Euphorbia peplus]|nr:hypothetical protein M5689_017329 [Euphorbia peplus]
MKSIVLNLLFSTILEQAKAAREGRLRKYGDTRKIPNYDGYTSEAAAQNKYFQYLATHVRDAEQSVNAITLATQGRPRVRSSGSLKLMRVVGNCDGDAEAKDKYVHFLEEHVRYAEQTANAVALVIRRKGSSKGSLNIMPKEYNYDVDAEGRRKYIEFIESHFRRVDQFANVIALVAQGRARLLRSGPLKIVPKLSSFDGDAEAKEKYFDLLRAHVCRAEQHAYRVCMSKASRAHKPYFILGYRVRKFNDNAEAKDTLPH